MNTKTLRLVTLTSMVLTLAAAILSVVGMALTGFYPGIIIMFLLTLVPIVSRSYVREKAVAIKVEKRAMTLLFLLNLLVILVVLWMSFVIVHDRVLKDCC